MMENDRAHPLGFHEYSLANEAITVWKFRNMGAGMIQYLEKFY